jgi:hypothetical protein
MQTSGEIGLSERSGLAGFSVEQREKKQVQSHRLDEEVSFTDVPNVRINEGFIVRRLKFQITVRNGYLSATIGIPRNVIRRSWPVIRVTKHRGTNNRRIYEEEENGWVQTGRD